MLQTTPTGHHTDHPIAQELWNWRAEALWVFAGFLLLIAFVDPLILLAVATLAATAAAWASWKARLHAATHRMELASPWRGTDAA